MTKKQNRSRGFGKRSLSVLLTVLLVLSTLVVMLSATSLSAGAAISYWNVAGDFNGWGSSLDNTSYRISGGSGSVTIPISSDAHSSIKFKMCAYENGWKWCGVGENSSDQNAYQDISLNTEVEMSWDKGVNMSVNLPSGTTQVTFELIVKNGKNNVKVTANGTGGGGGGDTSGMFYDAPVNTANNANKADNLFWATATYYDYMSDTELSDTQWLKPLQAGTHNYNGANDEWYPFYRFNREVVKAQADAQSNWAEPLYFGNFCDTNNAYDSPHHQNGYDSYGYREATNDYNVTRFVHIANNSDYNQAGSAHLANMNCSYQGLMSDHLSSSGDLLLPNGQTAPYFNASSLEGRAKVVNSSFPFKVQEVAGKKYKKYTFNSKNATDNVYFTWATDGNVTYPTGVNYGAGTTYGVKDGVSRFMNGGTSGYGIFPFNNASNNYKGTKTNANENLNYGFGIKTQVKFRVPAPDNANGVNTSSDPIYFRFSGDDDLWMYITDEDGNSQLVLDMGGDHKESTGYVNFNTLKATVDKVGTSGGSKTKSFTFDYSKTYTMTVFYMERGLIESNCEMEFTLTPMGNSFIVTEEINTVNVNAGLQDVVRQLSTFGFNTLNNGSQISDAEYGDFELGDGGRADIGDNALPINSNVKIKQYAPSNSYLTYDASWDYYDNVGSNGKTLLGSGTGVTSNGQTTVTSEQTLINDSGNEYDYAELQVDYVNTPQIGSFTVTKQMAEGFEAPAGKKFEATIYLQLKDGGSFTPYDLVDDDGATCFDGRFIIAPDETISFSGIPIGTRVYVVEGPDPKYTPIYTYTKDNPYIVDNRADITNIDIPIINMETPGGNTVSATVEGSKTLNGMTYTGDLFSFKLDGVGSLSGDSDKIVDTSDVQMTAQSVDSNGKFTFDMLSFNSPGIYRYIISEEDASSDYVTDTNKYLVVIEVVKEYDAYGPYFVLNGPYYQPYTGDTPTSADFENCKTAGATDPGQFVNEVKNGKVSVEKKGPNGESVPNTSFEVVKVDTTVSQILNDVTKTDTEKYDAIMRYSGRTIAGSDTTGAEGVAVISDLPIYEESFLEAHTTGGKISLSSSDTPAYQEYVLMETGASDGYTINKTLNVFQFPILGSYELTFSGSQAYVNGLIKNPEASGPGMLILKIVGLAIILFSMALLAYYVMNGKKKAAQTAYNARHMRRR